MTARMTLSDVARAAGVSTATVDRVLNGRPGVRARTGELVVEAARRLGYLAAPDQGAEALPPVELVFLFPAGTNSFIRGLKQQIEIQAALQPGLRARVESLDGFDPRAVARHLTELGGARVGVGVIAQDHPLVREAIRGLAAAGVPVVTLVSDIQNVPRLAYVGVDNRQAGRLAGHLAGRMLGRASSGRIALFAGSFAYRGHEEREMGFRHILREEFPGLRIVDLRETLDDRARAAEETRALLDQHPDIAAIYNVGGGTAGIGAALAERGRARDVLLIAHEATEANKRLLLDGTLDAAIDQNPRVEAREALNLLAAALRGRPYRYIPIRLQVVFKENLPEE